MINTTTRLILFIKKYKYHNVYIYSLRVISEITDGENTSQAYSDSERDEAIQTIISQRQFIKPNILRSCKYVRAVVEAENNTQTHLKHFVGHDVFDRDVFVNINESQAFSEGVHRFNVTIKVLWALQLALPAEASLAKCVMDGIFSAPAEDLVKLIFVCFYDNARFRLLCGNGFQTIVLNNRAIIDYSNFPTMMSLITLGKPRCTNEEDILTYLRPLIIICDLAESDSDESSGSGNSSKEVGTEKPSEEEVGTEKPSEEEVGTEKPSEEEVGTEKPSEEEVGTEKPSEEEVGTEKPSEEEVGTEKPSEEEVGTEKPSEEEVGTEKPSESRLNKIATTLRCHGYSLTGHIWLYKYSYASVFCLTSLGCYAAINPEVVQALQASNIKLIELINPIMGIEPNAIPLKPVIDNPAYFTTKNICSVARYLCILKTIGVVCKYIHQLVVKK